MILDDEDDGNMEDDEHISDDEDSIDDVEQLDDEILVSDEDDDDELWAIRESNEVVERVVRRVVGVVDDELGDVWRESRLSDSESLQITRRKKV